MELQNKGNNKMKSKEQVWIEKRGWHKVKGFKIDLETIRDLPDYWDAVFFDELDTYVEKVNYWQNDSYEEECFEEVDDVIDFIENNSEEKYE